MEENADTERNLLSFAEVIRATFWLVVFRTEREKSRPKSYVNRLKTMGLTSHVGLRVYYL